MGDGAVRVICGQVGRDQGDVPRAAVAYAGETLFDGFEVTVTRIVFGDAAHKSQLRAVMGVHEVSGDERARLCVVDADDVGVDLTAHVVHPHHRNPFLVAQFGDLFGVRGADHHQAVDADLSESGGELQLTFGVVTGVPDHRQVIPGAGLHLDAADELAEQRQGQVGHQESDLLPASRSA